MVGKLRQLVFCLLLQYAVGVTIFELKMIRFSNPNGRESDGGCCDFPCSDNCDPLIRVCFDKPGSGKCFNTGHYHSNQFNFESSFENGATNPLSVTINDGWTDSLLVSITVEDKDGFNANDPMGEIKKTFTRTPSISKAQANWNTMNFIFKYQVITAQARVYCANNFYGPDCLTFCSAKNNTKEGFYTCAEDGIKNCSENYFGPSCKTFCQPLNDAKWGRSTCDKEGQQVCLIGWTGTKCTEDVNECTNTTSNPCYPNAGCSNTEGNYTCHCSEGYKGRNCDEMELFCEDNPCSNTSTCNDTIGGFHCNCDDKWTGDRCDERVTPCTSSPCQNGGKCKVIGERFVCACVGPWEDDSCQTEILNSMNDTKVFFLKGKLPQSKWDDITKGIQSLIQDDLGVAGEITVETTITHPNAKVTKVIVYVESRDKNIVGSLNKIFRVLPVATVAQKLTLPMAEAQDIVEDTIHMSADPWIKKHWYVVLATVFIILGILAVIGVIMCCIKRLRKKKKEKDSFAARRSASGNGTLPDAAVGFDNSLYFEVNQPDKLRTLPAAPHR